MRDASKILVVEDDAPLRCGLIDLLVFHGFAVDAAEKTDQARLFLNLHSYDLVVLDVGLPDGDGFELCQEIRKEDPDALVLMLTARDSESDRIYGLSLGADHYVTKPFSSRELVLRIQNILRRTYKLPQPSQIVEFPNAQLDTAKRLWISSLNGNTVQLSKREIGILTYLFSRRPQSASRADILRNVWGYSRSRQIQTRTVDIHITKLRRKIESDPKQPKILLTSRGDGYSIAGNE